LIKYTKSVLWRVAKRLSSIEDERYLKVIERKSGSVSIKKKREGCRSLLS